MLEAINRRIAVVAVLLAALSAFLAYSYLQGLDEPVETVDRTQVVVASTNIPRDATIDAEMLEQDTVPTEQLHPSAVTDVESAVGGIAQGSIIAGEQVLEERVYNGEESGAKFSYRIPDSMRALSIGVTTVSGVSGLIDVGDRVDLVLTAGGDGAAEEEGQAQGGSETFTMLQNIEVLAVGGRIIEWADGEAHEVPALTLAVTPEEAQEIAMSRSMGSLQLSLRSPVDERTLTLPAVDSVEISEDVPQ